MSNENKMKNTKNNKKSDGKFKSKHINHNPQEESARAKYGLQSTTSDGNFAAYENKGE